MFTFPLKLKSYRFDVDVCVIFSLPPPPRFSATRPFPAKRSGADGRRKKFYAGTAPRVSSINKSDVVALGRIISNDIDNADSRSRFRPSGVQWRRHAFIIFWGGGGRQYRARFFSDGAYSPCICMYIYEGGPSV